MEPVQVQLERDYDFTAEDAWAVLAAFGDLSWAGVTLARVEGDGPGMVRHIALGGGATLAERLEDRDDDARRYTYSVEAAPFLPWTTYRAEVRIAELDGERCRVTRLGKATPREGRAPDVRAMLDKAYRRSLDALPAAVAARSA